MISSKLTKCNFGSLSRVVKEETQAVIAQKLQDNVWATPSRSSPNADKLQDGAVQRKAVTLDEVELNFVKANKDKVGFYKREELNAKASLATYCHSDPGNT